MELRKMEVELSGVKWSGMERNVVTLDGNKKNGMHTN